MTHQNYVSALKHNCNVIINKFGMAIYEDNIVDIDIIIAIKIHKWKLGSHIKLGVEIHPAGTSLGDNFDPGSDSYCLKF